MICIHFSDPQTERKAIGFLFGRFSCKSFSDGKTLVPEAALAALAREGISFIVEGPATYQQCIPTVRDSSPAEVQ
ncbi:MAG: hypothetical protein KY476_21360 [Planctomycetes bacterium]|nr:hypothetical protein [Planctomycetota bacterium]